MIRKDLSDHYVVCPYRNVECKFCNNAIHFYLMEVCKLNGIAAKNVYDSCFFRIISV